MSKFTKIRDAVLGFIKGEARKVAKFLKPTIAQILPQAKQFAMEDLSTIVLAASKCLSKGKGEACALDAAVASVKILAKKQGVELAQTAAVSLAATLVAKAKEENKPE